MSLTDCYNFVFVDHEKLTLYVYGAGVISFSGRLTVNSIAKL